jgi:hypothetical protein
MQSGNFTGVTEKSGVKPRLISKMTFMDRWLRP